jgi:hypothetical protein
MKVESNWVNALKRRYTQIFKHIYKFKDKYVSYFPKH